MSHAHTDAPPENPATSSEGSTVLMFVASLVVAAGGASFGSAIKPDTVEVTQASPRAASGSSFAIATAAPEASKAAAKILAQGGNAYDALVTASFVVSVVRPQSTGIGGGGFVVFHDAKTGKNGAWDGRESAPASSSKHMYVEEGGKVSLDYRFGPRAGGIPGLVAMLGEVHSTYGSGKFSWAELIAPAIQYAEEGFEVPAPLAATIRARRDQLERWSASKRVFLPNGRPPKTGELLKQPQLGKTLRAIAKGGAKAFYTGWVAHEMIDAVNAAGGSWTQKDMHPTDLGGEGELTEAAVTHYHVKSCDPVVGKYRGHTVVSMPPPSSGGTAIMQMLNMLSAYDLKQMGHNTPRTIHLLAEVMRRAFADRYAFVADPAFEQDPEKEEIFRQRVLQATYADHLRASIDLSKASRSSDVKPRKFLVTRESDHTTHISIVDKHGNAVASTQTINTGLGSCFVAGDTGVLLNNEMADFTASVGKANPFGLQQGPQNLPEPGKRPMSSMSPTLVFSPGGGLKAVIGSPGGPKIINAVLQVLINLVDFKMSAKDAMDAARIHHQWEPDQLLLESDLNDRLHALVGMGHRVKVLPPGVGLGNAQTVVVEGRRTGVSDKRGTGRPAAK